MFSPEYDYYYYILASISLNFILFYLQQLNLTVSVWPKPIEKVSVFCNCFFFILFIANFFFQNAVFDLCLLNSETIYFFRLVWRLKLISVSESHLCIVYNVLTMVNNDEIQSFVDILYKIHHSKSLTKVLSEKNPHMQFNVRIKKIDSLLYHFHSIHCPNLIDGLKSVISKELRDSM